MVKIKEGYVMNAREKAEFDRVNIMQRKTSGRVDFYYKPQTKYPPRIYLYMHAETWCDRNRRPMGLFHAIPFLSRPMNKEEIEYHHFDIRLCYHQYEDWDKLIYAEEQEACELDKENPGSGIAFLNELKSYRERYPIGEQQAAFHPVRKVDKPESEESSYIQQLIRHGENYSAAEIADLMRKEQEGEKRATILIILRELYRNFEKTEKTLITPKLIERKVFNSQERTRKNFIRRVYKKNKLFALEEIRSRYPDYNEQQLADDLKQKTSKVKAPKTSQVLDLRRCQLEKLAFRLKICTDEAEYHQMCCRMVMLQTAHDQRLPIPLTVKLQDEILVYSFNWKTKERTVKSFVDLANTKGMTHKLLENKYQELLGATNGL